MMSGGMNGRLFAIGLLLYGLVLAGGVIALRWPGALPAGQELSFERAVFAVANAASLTGFLQTVSMEQYRPAGHAVVGAMACAGALLSLVVGGSAVARLAGVSVSAGRLLAYSAGAMGVAAGLGAILLSGASGGWAAGAFLGLSAFANSGLHSGALLPATPWAVHGVMLPLAVAGGLGMVVLIELNRRLVNRAPLSRHSRVVLLSSAAVYLVGVAGIMLLDNRGSWRAGLVEGSLVALNTRSAGFGVMSVRDYSPAAQWMIMGLMMIGAAPGGTGGGVKVTALAVLAAGALQVLRGQGPGRLRVIAAAWVVVFMGMVGLTLALLTLTEPQMVRWHLMMLSMSAVSNAGLSHDPVMITGPGLYVMSGAMLAGRLVPLGVLWMAAGQVRPPAVAVG
jgi:trk system potassium uptake protein